MQGLYIKPVLIMILIPKEAGWSITRPVVKLQMITGGVCPEWKHDPTTVETEKESEKIKEKVVELGITASTYTSLWY